MQFIDIGQAIQTASYIVITDYVGETFGGLIYIAICLTTYNYPK